MWTLSFVLMAVLPVSMTMSVLKASKNDLTAMDEWNEVRTAALKRLLEVFGMEETPNFRGPHKQPPQYMLDLYNAVADMDGVTKDPDLLQGNTVRSFFDKLHSEEVKFLFNLTNVSKKEKILTAELHLFKVKLHDSLTFNRHHFCQVSVYQLYDGSNTNTSQSRKLLSSRLIPVYSTGWEVFYITNAVRSSMEHEDNSLAFMVTVRSLGGSQTEPKLVRFASGQHHHQSKQPMLVLFTDDGRKAAMPSKLKDTTGTSAPLPHALKSVNRNGRSLEDEEEEHEMPCQRQPLYVDFEEIGWSSWIVSPRGYNAYHCKGSCFFPLGQSLRPTNHATVQSIIHALKLSQGIETPCCVPDKLFSISLLYFDDDENVVLKQYDNMVAGSCGCH